MKTENIENYEALCEAVVEQAIHDYIDVKFNLEKSFDRLDDLIDFFSKNGGYEMYQICELSGAEIMKQCDRIVEKKLNRWRKHQKHRQKK